MMKNLFDRLKNKLSTRKSVLLPVLLGLVALGLCALSSFNFGDKKEVKESSISLDTYRAELEKRVTALTNEITGGKNASVMITLETGENYTYADELKQSRDDKTGGGTAETGEEVTKSYITVRSSDGGEKPLITSTRLPEVRGVAIVCQCSDADAERVKSAVTAALGITSKRIYIANNGRKKQ